MIAPNLGRVGCKSKRTTAQHEPSLEQPTELDVMQDTPFPESGVVQTTRKTKNWGRHRDRIGRVAMQPRMKKKKVLWGAGGEPVEQHLALRLRVRPRRLR